MLDLRKFAGALALVIGVTGCSLSGASTTEQEGFTPTARWDYHPEATGWTDASLQMLQSDAAILTELEPADIDQWCPAYLQGDAEQRAAFWNGILSALAFHESTHRPDAIGGNGRWFGLTQIVPATARGYGCEAGSADALLDGEANLQCALRIWATTVPRDGVISEGMRGIAADWGPFHSSRKREDMRQWVSQQEYCAG